MSLLSVSDCPKQTVEWPSEDSVTVLARLYHTAGADGIRISGFVHAFNQHVICSTISPIIRIQGLRMKKWKCK